MSLKSIDNSEFSFSFRVPAVPHQRPSGHVSLKQTAHLRSHSSVNRSEVLSYLQRNNNSTNVKEPANSLSAATPKTAIENGIGYVPYSPYAVRRRDSITRPYSPASGTQAGVCSSLTRPYSPSYRQFQATEYNYEKRLQASNGGLKTSDNYVNGYRSYSPYRGGVQSLAEAEARPYSPYCGRRYEERDSSRERWQTGPRSLSPFARDYSPWRRENVDPPVIQLPVTNDKYTPSSIVKQRFEQFSAAMPQSQMHNVYASPMLSRKR